ncbi:MAG TPA: hypothetical protein VGJ84_18775, partial [Polyangiaceae bacterium]
LCTTDKCVSSTCQHAQIACFTGFCCPDTGVCSQCCSDFDCGGITTQSSSTIIPINSCCCNGMCQSCTILCPITI